MEDWVWEGLGGGLWEGKEAGDFLAKGPVRSCTLDSEAKAHFYS